MKIVCLLLGTLFTYCVAYEVQEEESDDPPSYSVVCGDPSLGIGLFRSSLGLYEIHNSDAEEVCATVGRRLCSYSELSNYQQNGGNCCACGWLDDELMYYPMQEYNGTGCCSNAVCECGQSTNNGVGVGDVWCCTGQHAVCSDLPYDSVCDDGGGGHCTVVAKTKGATCSEYCNEHGYYCIDGWDDVVGECSFSLHHGCEQRFKNQICKCKAASSLICADLHDHGMECEGGLNYCTVFAKTGGTCSEYCNQYGYGCADGWDDNGKGCGVRRHVGCETQLKTQICKCEKAPLAACSALTYDSVCDDGGGGHCTVLATTKGATCSEYCNEYGYYCIDGWDDVAGECSFSLHHGCEQRFQNQICKCRAGLASSVICADLRDGLECEAGLNYCTVFAKTGGTCSEYCNQYGYDCADGWDNNDKECGFSIHVGCETQLKTQICKCENDTVPHRVKRMFVYTSPDTADELRIVFGPPAQLRKPIVAYLISCEILDNSGYVEEYGVSPTVKRVNAGTREVSFENLQCREEYECSVAAENEFGVGESVTKRGTPLCNNEPTATDILCAEYGGVFDFESGACCPENCETCSKENCDDSDEAPLEKNECCVVDVLNWGPIPCQYNAPPCVSPVSGILNLTRPLSGESQGALCSISGGGLIDGDLLEDEFHPASVIGCMNFCSPLSTCGAFDFNPETHRCRAMKQFLGYDVGAPGSVFGVCEPVPASDADLLVPDGCERFEGYQPSGQRLLPPALYETGSEAECYNSCAVQNCSGASYFGPPDFLENGQCWIWDLFEEINRKPGTNVIICKPAVPLPPADVEVNYFGNTAMLKIVQPWHAGGTPVQHYLVQIHLDGTATGEPDLVNVDNPTLEVTIPPEATAVKFEVQAVNTAGGSPVRTTPSHHVHHSMPEEPLFPWQTLLILGLLPCLVAGVFCSRFRRFIIRTSPRLRDFGNRLHKLLREEPTLLETGERWQGDRNAEPSAPPDVSELPTDLQKISIHGSLPNFEPSSLADEPGQDRDRETEDNAGTWGRQKDSSMSNLDSIVCYNYQHSNELETSHVSELSDDKLRPFPCKYCGRKFKKVSPCNQHQLTHEGKLFICDICQKEYTRKSSLERHEETEHKGVRHKCTKCEKRIRGKTNLKTHMKNLHGKRNSWECEHFDCRKRPKGFSAKAALQNHIKNLHDDCEICCRILKILKPTSTTCWKRSDLHNQVLRAGNEMDDVHDSPKILLSDTVPETPTFGDQDHFELKWDLPQQMQLDIAVPQLEEPELLPNELQEPPFSELENPFDRTEFLLESPSHETETPFDEANFLMGEYDTSPSVFHSPPQLDMSGILNSSDQEQFQYVEDSAALTSLDILNMEVKKLKETVRSRCPLVKGVWKMKEAQLQNILLDSTKETQSINMST